MKKGLLLINLGTPQRADFSAVWHFLEEFLADKRVITLPAVLRYLLLYGVILPFRTRQSTHAYQTIWRQDGSPLLFHGQALCRQLQTRLGPDYHVILGMRYGKPSIAEALTQLHTCEHITLLPLYPQYSSAATGSSIEKALRIIASQSVIPSVNIIRDFYQQPSFIHAQAEQIRPYINNHDHILFSYHGLPESHLKSAGCKRNCNTVCPPPSFLNQNQACYRAQCFHTTALIADALDLTQENYSSAFQSRLGKTPWIKPYTDEQLSQLAARGIKRLAVTCPSFVADCLETLEEIGIRAKEQWLALGGEQFTLIPCMNDSKLWIEAIATIIK